MNRLRSLGSRFLAWLRREPAPVAERDVVQAERDLESATPEDWQRAAEAARQAMRSADPKAPTD